MSENDLRFEPSKELKQARELTEIAQQSGHQRPILDFPGLFGFFDVLENEERKVFDLQMSVGALAVENDKLRSQRDAAQQAAADFAVGGANDGRKDQGAYHLLRELVEQEPLAGDDNYVECIYCFATSHGMHLTHAEDCLYRRAKELFDE